jgi:MbnP
MRFTSYRSSCLAVLAASVLGVVACGEDTTAPATPSTIDVYFNLNVDGPGLRLNDLSYATPAGTKYSIKVLKFVISDVVLHADDGKTAKLADVHYFDVGDGSTQTFRDSSVPHANWVSVSFTFGLDESKNVRDKYQTMTKFHAAMQWPTGLGANLGYHYMQLEGNYETSPGGATAGYTTHTGARQLDGTNPDFPGVVDATPYHYFFTVDLPFTPTHIHEAGHGELELFFNLNDWYLDSTPADGNDTSYDFTTLGNQMIMGNLDAQARLQANGRFCFSAVLRATGGHDH